MSKPDEKYERDYQKGRADAAKGKWDDPGPGFWSPVFSSVKEIREKETRKERYREGWHDKKREMEQEKKKH